MNFCFYSERTFESWDWNTPLEVGIGGSETSHVEMAQRLARRGHDVMSVAPVPLESSQVTDLAGVRWSSVDLDRGTGPADAVNVIYRAPHLVEQIPEGVPAWLICQDADYRTMTEAYADRFTRIIALCEDHAAHLRSRYPYLASKVCVSSNGIRSELIRERIEAQRRGEVPARNPKRLMYASSPDRGLWTLLSVFERLRELVPDVELHVCYGFNNLEKVVEQAASKPSFARQVAARNMATLEALKAPGIVHHGRINQRDIIDEWLQSGVWCHPSQFTETSCITCMDAQACGAIPVTTPVWAIAENVRFGLMVEGFPETDPLTQARYVNQLLHLVQDPERQDEIRRDMMPWAAGYFNWENFVTQWEAWAAEDLAGMKPHVYRDQFGFQFKFSTRSDSERRMQY